MTTELEAVARRLGPFIEELTPQWPVLGGAISIIDGDGGMEAFGFGLADRERGIPATPDHVFQVGSISKTFLSLLIHQLAAEGAMGFDEAIAEILPWLDLGSDGDSITVTHLLTHTSGLILGGDGVPDDLAQLLSLDATSRSASAIGRFHYSNVGFMLLGKAVEARTGQRLASVMEERLIRPLGMRSSRAEIVEADRPHMAVGYWPARDDVPWHPGDSLERSTWFSVFSADGNVACTARDMAAFLALLLSDASSSAASLLPPGTIDHMIQTTAPSGEDVVALRDGPLVSDSRYGLGVNVETVDGATCLTHGGGMVGFQSFFIADRTAGLGVAVLTNANGCYPVAQVIARAAHHLASGQRTRGSLPPLPPGDQAVDDTAPARQGDEMTGTFKDALGYSITVRGHEPRLEVTAGGVKGELTRIWTGRYVTNHPDLRPFRWDARADGESSSWVSGPRVFHRRRGADTVAESHPDSELLVGTYRSYSPWFPRFSIIERDGMLFLAAPGGVEAPSADMELVALPGGTYRIGRDSWLPERLAVARVVDGKAASLLRDGVEYSRTSSPTTLR